ncbi:MAG: tRNA dihydrouridine synthase DusB [Pseudomonadales bacterium]|nr:tRNA dihydrouridine synthase DusB [Pseudomonadales bacterium]
MLTIGSHHLDNNLILAPMAGITDLPFRKVCKQLGAGLSISEMVTSDQRLWQSRKSLHRLNHVGEIGLNAIQIAGTDPQMMAQAAQICSAEGAQIIDINMGCPAKKVCKKAAGSALLKDEALVANILETVVNAVSVPVTLKIRTGWCKDTRNALSIAKIAEQSGIAALTIHGRTRACRFKGCAEYDTIAEVVQRSNIPIIANGDINTPDKAQFVLDYTGADAIMVGRAAQGRPWIFSEIDYFLKTGVYQKPPMIGDIKKVIVQHLTELHNFYGEFLGVRIARKHFGWYLAHLPQGACYSSQFNSLQSVTEQNSYISSIFQNLDENERLAA